jgi:hypothetical protein
MQFESLEPPFEIRWGAGVRFLGEHDAPPERELKVALSGEFAHTPGVRSAYLARVAYGGTEPAGEAPEVALCIRSSAPEDAAFTGRVGRVYGGRRAHLDVLFLSDEQEVALSAVCPPFYRAD